MTDPTSDLAYIKSVIARTHRRVDPHAFHFVVWGALVLLAYPAMNALCLAGHYGWAGRAGLAALVVGALASTAFEMRLRGKSRVPGEDTFLARQIVWIVYANIGVAALLSAIGPASGIVSSQSIPLVWGFAYANLATMLGVVYSREYLVAGGAILAATILAMFLPRYSGFILGPAMGLGLIVPGIMAERRVAREPQ